MDYHKLDGLISELSELIRESKSILSFSGSFVTTPTEIIGFQRNDWRPVWAKCKEIQSGFTARPRYPTREAQNEAWLRFNNLRNEASALANEEREKFHRMSLHFRDLILDEIKYARYHPIDDVLFFFDPTTIADMKHMSQKIAHAGKILSENKQRMSKEHKDECFGQIQEARESHQLFWEHRKAAIAQRHSEWQTRLRAHIARAETNIDKNEMRLAKQQDALSRVEAQIDDLTEKVNSARSDEWRDRFSEWLSAAREKRSSIEGGIDQTKRWLEQDRERLDQMWRKLDE